MNNSRCLNKINANALGEIGEDQFACSLSLVPITFCVPAEIGILSKPPSGREGDHEVVEGACAAIELDQTDCLRTLPQSAFSRQLPPGGSLMPTAFIREHIVSWEFCLFGYVSLRLRRTISSSVYRLTHHMGLFFCALCIVPDSVGTRIFCG